MNKKNSILLFLYALFSRATVNFVGSLMLSEILAVISLPFMGLKKLFLKYSLLKPVTIAYTGLLLLLMFSDFINATPPPDYMRGWASVIMSFISTLFIIKQLDKNTGNIIFYLIGFSISMILFGREQQTTEIIDIYETQENTGYFKFYIAPILNSAILILGYWLFKVKKNKLTVLLYVCYSLLCFVLGGRSNGLIFFIASLLLLPKVFPLVKVKRSLVVFFSVTLLLFSYLLYVYYVNSVLTENIGSDTARDQLRRAENPYNPIRLLEQGRSEFFIAIQAIKEKPVIGYGSWPKDPTRKFVSLYYDIKGKGNVYINFKEESLIPSHSILLGAWIFAGIGGLICILGLFYCYFGCIRLIFKSKIIPNTLPVIAVLGSGMTWDFFFSPFSHMRFVVPAIAALLIVESYNITKRLKKPDRI